MQIRDLNADEISCRVQSINKNGCSLLLYKTARVDSQILDEVYGSNNWTNDFKVVNDNLFCGIGVRATKEDNFVWKWDCGVESKADKEKGEASDAFKRAGFKWGIGVELYSVPFIFIKVPTEEKNGSYKLKDQFVKFSVSKIKTEEKKIVALEIVDNNGNVVFSQSKKPSKKVEEPKKENPKKEIVKDESVKKENTPKEQDKDVSFNEVEKQVIYSDDFDKWSFVLSKAESYDKLKLLYEKWVKKFPKGSPQYDKLLAITTGRKKELE